MPCKIAGQSQEVEAVLWKPLASRPIPALPQPPGAVVSAAPGEAEQLKARLAEMERSRHIEITQVKQNAFQEGVRQGRSEVAAEAKSATDRVAQVVAELAGLKRKLRNDAELELIKLSLAIARRILHRELSTDPEAIQGIVHTALQKLQNREISRVRVYPAAADAVRNSLEQIGAAPAIQVIPDSTLNSGGLVFETSFGELEASVETQLQEIQRGFADRVAL